MWILFLPVPFILVVAIILRQMLHALGHRGLDFRVIQVLNDTEVLASSRGRTVHIEGVNTSNFYEGGIYNVRAAKTGLYRYSDVRGANHQIENYAVKQVKRHGLLYYFGIIFLLFIGLSLLKAYLISH